MNKGKSKYRIHGCIEQIQGDKIYVESHIPYDKADFWGVYVVEHNGFESNIADFIYKADAELFVRVKETDAHTNMVCARCGHPVYKSDNPEYSYQCFNCDEDLYSFEVKVKTEKTEGKNE